MSQKDLTEPKIGDTIFNGKDCIISSVDSKSERFWADNDTLCYFFEDVIKDTENANRWVLVW